MSNDIAILSIKFKEICNSKYIIIIEILFLININDKNKCQTDCYHSTRTITSIIPRIFQCYRKHPQTAYGRARIVRFYERLATSHESFHWDEIFLRLGSSSFNIGKEKGLVAKRINDIKKKKYQPRKKWITRSSWSFKRLPLRQAQSCVNVSHAHVSRS